MSWSTSRCSPPTRGWTRGLASSRVLCVVFPAYAGMDRPRTGGTGGEFRVPRLRGDGPEGQIEFPVHHECSPPTRGWTGPGPRHPDASNVFPAYAGMDRSQRSRSKASARVPRLRGMDRPWGRWSGSGLSVPRLRGDGPATRGNWNRTGSCSPPTRGWTGRR